MVASAASADVRRALKNIDTHTRTHIHTHTHLQDLLLVRERDVGGRAQAGLVQQPRARALHTSNLGQGQHLGWRV